MRPQYKTEQEKRENAGQDLNPHFPILNSAYIGQIVDQKEESEDDDEEELAGREHTTIVLKRVHLPLQRLRKRQ